MGFLLRGLLLLGRPGSRAQVQLLWRMGLVALGHVESSWIRDQTRVSCIDRQILYHWATREVPSLSLINNNISSNNRCFPGSSAGEESAYKAGDLNSIPGSGRSTGEGIGYPLQYSWIISGMLLVWISGSSVLSIFTDVIIFKSHNSLVR